ncbi:MAG TPA: mechanosensitive ion channel family protein [Candidatus Binataceae bacterium]|nr:mechanosensitive ion channel family protein [Candidatus Binataceae bacterium]
MTPSSAQTLLGLHLVRADLRLSIELLSGIFAALFAMRMRRRKGAVRPAGFNLLALGMFTDAAASALAGLPPLHDALEAVGLIFLLWAIILLSLDLAEASVRRRRRHFSTIFKDLLMVLGCSLVVGVVLRSEFHVDVAPLVASGAVASIVLGLALQETLGNIFSGLTLQLEKPFEPGDWVRVANNVGRVLGIGWRSTSVVTLANERLEIPNAMIAKDVLTNYTAEAGVGDEIAIGISYLEPPNRVREVILRALLDVADVARTPEPEIYAWEYGDYAIRYRIRYWLTDYGLREVVRDRVTAALWYVMRRNSIEVPFPIRTLQFRHTRRERDSERAYESKLIEELRRVDFLHDLTDEELQMLAGTVQTHEFGAGEVLVRQGAAGDSFFIIRRGSVEVMVEHNNGQRVHVADLEPPAFFGEIALMTGEQRNATVMARTDVEVLEMDRDAFTHLFHNHPDVTTRIGEVISARLSERRDILAALPDGDGSRARRNWLMQKMRAVFDLR